MYLTLCDIPIEWRGTDCPRDLAVFGQADAEHDRPRLIIEGRSVDTLPVFPEPEVVTGVTAMAHRGDVLVGWNTYEGMPDRTAALEFDGARATVLIGPRTWECSVLNMVMLSLLPVVSRAETLLVHASLVEYDGRAVAFTAASGTGKSTQADLWVEHLGAQIMNGDRAFIRRIDGQWNAYGSPWSGSSPYVRNVWAPLAAVVVLEQAPCNRIRPLGALEMMPRLYNNIRYPFWDQAATEASLATLDAMMKEVPIYLLSCRPDEEAARMTRDAVFGA